MLHSQHLSRNCNYINSVGISRCCLVISKSRGLIIFSRRTKKRKQQANKYRMRHSDIQVLVVVFVTVVLGLLDTLCKCEEGSSIVKQALGRVAQLGSLYDARRDSFCEYSLFKRSLPDSKTNLSKPKNYVLQFKAFFKMN